MSKKSIFPSIIKRDESNFSLTKEYFNVLNSDTTFAGYLK